MASGNLCANINAHCPSVSQSVTRIWDWTRYIGSAVDTDV